jgi:hypothetical protein
VSDFHSSVEEEERMNGEWVVVSPINNQLIKDHITSN